MGVILITAIEAISSRQFGHLLLRSQNLARSGAARLGEERKQFPHMRQAIGIERLE